VTGRAVTAAGRGRRSLLAAFVLAVTGSFALAAPAYAAEGSIDHVERKGDVIQVLYSLPGSDAEPDLDSLTVAMDATQLSSEAELATDASTKLRRTTVLAIDVSSSMRTDNRFGEAQRAAKAFLDAAPDDLYVGIVTFAGKVTVAQEPSLDRAESARVIDSLELSNQTHLYDGLLEAVDTSGGEGSRSLLVLSDGRDTSDTALNTVTGRIGVSRVKVDVVALGLSAEETAVLQQLADAGNGTVINADDPTALTEVFAAEAENIARQILISATVPPGENITEGTLAVSVTAGGTTYSDSAFVNVAKSTGPAPGVQRTKLVPAEDTGFDVSQSMMLAGIAAAGVGCLVLLLSVLGAFGSKGETVEDRISAYTRKGSRKLSQSRAQQAQPQGVTAQAVGIAEKALEGSGGLAPALGVKLEAAGMSMKPAEWLLAHAGIAFLAGLMALLLSSGSILWTLIGLFLGLFLPWVYLSFKRSRRLKAFKYGLADTLQLMSGSLSAGLSLAQSVDTVVREGSEPICSEFRRALVEARLGVEIEDALAGVSERMESVDFEWVVMAIRIQREVGGNLSELLNNVAATIREREYLERQVSALSAEGRLSVWILGGLPPGFLAYLMMANPDYLDPLISTTIGYVMLGVMAVLETSGILWMKKLVKVDV
jgi:tight adherence protein B